MLMTLFGGLGLFLLGMSLLTEGLKALAGDSLRSLLARFTGDHFSALVTGTLTTAFIQSSSATTLLTIGFISAGLLSFEQSIGLILGANLGTTSTAWIVSTIGLKIQVSKLALPLIGCGAGIELFGSGRIKKAGLVFAGFGLLFLGIDMMQEAMKSLSGQLRPESFPSPGLLGSALLVLMGTVMTVVMQSSSAAVATTLTAVHAGSLSIEQAMALVIGQNIGTTATAALASIGGSISSRRAALAHTLFNVFTAGIVFLGLPLLGPWTIQLSLVFGLSEPAQQLALFHSLFNLAGILAIWPFLARFTALIVSLIREDKTSLTRYLGPMVAKSGLVALEAARRTQSDIFARLITELRRTLSGAELEEQASAFNDIHTALVTTRSFLADVDSGDSVARIEHQRHVELLHSLDHMSRLLDALRERESWSDVRNTNELTEIVTPLLSILQSAESELQQGDTEGLIDLLKGASIGIADKRRTGRPALLT
jgi:phosphate:Na+ symporter